MNEKYKGYLAGFIGLGSVVIALILILLLSTPLSPNLPPLAEEELNTAFYPYILLVLIPGVIIGVIIVWRNDKK